MDDEKNYTRDSFQRMGKELEKIADGDVRLADLSVDLLHLLMRAVERLLLVGEWEDDTHLYTIYDEINKGRYSDQQILEMESDGTFTPDKVRMDEEGLEDIIEPTVSRLYHLLRSLSMEAHERDSAMVTSLLNYISAKNEEKAQEATPQMIADIYEMLRKEGDK